MKLKLIVFFLILILFFIILSPISFGLILSNHFYDLGKNDIEFLYLDNNYNSKNFDSSINGSILNDNILIINLFKNYIKSPNRILDGPADSAWPMKCHDWHNTGRSSYSTSHISGLEKWRFRTREGVDGSPIVDNSGVIYIGDKNGWVYSIYPNGTLKWESRSDDWDFNSCAPALSEDGILYICSHDDHIYAYDSGTGSLLWKKDLGRTIESDPVIANDGTVYTADFDARVWAIYPNGTLRWRYDTNGDYIIGDIALGDNGTLYIGSSDGHFWAINPNGTLRWKYKTGGQIRGPASIDNDGVVYIYSWDDYLYAFYPNNGTVKWQTYIQYGEETNPAIAQDSTLYLGGEKLWAIYPNGTIRWVFNPGNGHQIDKSCPAISSEGTIYFGTQINNIDGGDIIAINPDGTEIWRKRIAHEWILSSPCIGEDGTIFIGSQADVGRGYLHAFGPVSSNSAPDIPLIQGKVKGHVGVEQMYKVTGYDPDNNPLRFFIDWGDGSEGWTDERASGELNYFYHTYTEKGSYTIKAKVKDTLGAESDWATYAIRIPYSNTINNLLQWIQNTFPHMARLLVLINDILENTIIF